MPIKRTYTTEKEPSLDGSSMGYMYDAIKVDVDDLKIPKGQKVRVTLEWYEPTPEEAEIEAEKQRAEALRRRTNPTFEEAVCDAMMANFFDALSHQWFGSARKEPNNAGNDDIRPTTTRRQD